MEIEVNDIKEKIDNIKIKFFSVLDDYKKYYIFTNKNPEVEEYQNFYINIRNELQNLSKELVDIQNNIVNKTKISKTDSKLYSDELDKINNNNKELEDLLDNLKNTQNGSEILINDTKKMYRTQYYKNIEIIIGIFGIIYLFITLFRQTSNSS
jgi:predicted  nucleic acid-binding Zn-ribbon protein